MKIFYFGCVFAFMNAFVCVLMLCSCVDRDGFVRGVQHKLQCFSKHHFKRIIFCWRADAGLTLNSGISW